jgi:hypothetical protein
MVGLKGTGVGALSVTASGPFANTGVGAASPEITFTVTNAAGTPTTGILHSAIGGTNGDQFEVTSDTCAGVVLDASETCTVKVRFVPSATGVKVGTLTVTGTPGGSGQATLSATATAAGPT